jgi:formylglycine-generating enzyme required for sulfatase activity
LILALLDPHAESPAAPDLASFYVKEATWQQTMHASRARWQAWRQEDEAARSLSLGPWYTTGPLKAAGFVDALFPEQDVDLTAKSNDDKRELWHKEPEWLDGEVVSLPGGDSVSTYLYRTVSAKTPVCVNASFGSDDGMELWLNGQKLVSRDAARVAAPGQELVVLDLAAGEHSLLLKVFNIGGSHSFYCSILPDASNALWDRIEQDFPVQMTWVNRDAPRNVYLAWFNNTGNVLIEKQMISRVLADMGADAPTFRDRFERLEQAGAAPDDPQWLDLYATACQFRNGLETLRRVNFRALRMAIQDLAATFPGQYPGVPSLLERADAFEQRLPKILETLAAGKERALRDVDEVLAFQREALFANPLLDFDSLLLVKRGEGNLGLPQNWQGNCALAKTGYDNEIAVLSPVRPGGALTTLFRPEQGEFAGDVDLHFDADRMLFSMPGSHGRWQIWEIGSDGVGLRQVTPGEEPDVDNYDACYLPDGRIAFASTRCFQGIPCVGGSNTVANLCLMNYDGTGIRQLCFDQDHNWCPTVLNNGRVLYTRWEYSDTPHYFSRLLFSMNPDGTNQAEYYGSNSFWPNSTFYARPIPGHPTEVVAIISGHHGVPRMGELVLFDPAKGRYEADGVVQRVPGYGQKVEPVIVDTLVDESWPKFLHPYPLSDKYFLVSCKPTPDARWGIYLADVFDNIVPIAEAPGYALFEPIPLRKTPKPPVIPDRVRPDSRDGTVYLVDVYRGQGLKGVPRGAVKKLRLYEFHYCYPQMGGHICIGVEGPWDVHRILGTVPVYEDGSALFTVPANTPIAVQPLDEEGKALQIMRSWFVAMPGEAVSCVGCHERQNSAAPVDGSIAARRAPSSIEPWYGPARGFSFKREVQPVLDRYCVGCHGGRPNSSGKEVPDFSAKEKNGWGNFTPSYLALHPYVRRPGPESDYHLQTPLEFHADTSELVQMLEKGHHGVNLDAEAWDRLITWIDLNVPDHGTWHENQPIAADFHTRRLAMRTQYANRPEDPEAIPDIPQERKPFVMPKQKRERKPVPVPCPGWPFDATEAQRRQAAAGSETRRALDLGNGAAIELALIPAGKFVMGGEEGFADERPRARVTIEKPFWMGVLEVTNRQFARFDPAHENGVLDQHHKDHTTRGYDVSGPDLPVIRVPWEQALAFCDWMGERVGEPVTLPTEAQWEWACRAGADTPFYYGDLNADFSPFANLADLSIKLLAVTGVNPQPIKNPSRYEDFIPKDARFDDHERVMADAGRYQPNAWGLYDVHGNVAEWTRTAFEPYPYREDGRNDLDRVGKKVVRGGSWRDRPQNARASFRLAYRAYQPVYNVGFRVIIPVQ